MSNYAAVRRQFALRQAEGFLELTLPKQALDALGRIEDLPGGKRGHAAYLRGEALRALERYQEAIAPLELASRDATDAIAARLAELEKLGATLVDVSGIIIYFVAASLFLGRVLN